MTFVVSPTNTATVYSATSTPAAAVPLGPRNATYMFLAAGTAGDMANLWVGKAGVVSSAGYPNFCIPCGVAIPIRIAGGPESEELEVIASTATDPALVTWYPVG